MEKRAGFTLIEIAIVLVVIGLIVGGVLVGRDMIDASYIRAQISQIQQYQAAVHTFENKYGFLPGDIRDPYATKFGFTSRGPYAGEGDGNGVIEGVNSNTAGSNYGTYESTGETVMFWEDLTYANGQNLGLIDGNFLVTLPRTGLASYNLYCCSLLLTGTPSTTAYIKDYMPAAKIGGGNYIYVWSGGPTGGNGLNYFALNAINTIYKGGIVVGNPGLSVSDAYNIDTKIDDGLPQSGNVITSVGYTDVIYNGNEVYCYYAAGGANCGANHYGNPTTAATQGSATTCYDNGNVLGVTQTYSMEKNNGSGINCDLSFQFQ